MSLWTELPNYISIQSNLFVKIEVGYYKATSGSTPTAQDLLFSDKIESTVVDGDTYVGLGKLMSVGSSSSELRVTPNEVTIVISGIPNSSISEVINSRIKGSPVTISRALFDSNTGALLSFSGGGNPMIRFKGYVNNLSLDEDYNVESRTSTNTLVLTCASNVDIMETKISGRKTNPSSMKKFYPADISMDRVPTLENSFFDFGAKK